MRLILAAALVCFSAPALGQAPLRDGAAIYNDKCTYCHAERGWGTRELAKRTEAGKAKLLDRTDLSSDFVVAAVRRGIGSMPAFTPTDMTDAELDVLAKWLEGRKRQK
jgi:mono/diheme cytochrome c family protein